MTCAMMGDGQGVERRCASRATLPGRMTFPTHLLTIALTLVVAMASACTVDTARPTATPTHPPTLLLTVVPSTRGPSSVLPTPTVVPASPIAAPDATPAPAESEPPTQVAEPEGVTSHTVASGDTLLGIAMAFDVPMAAIQLQNNLGEATTVRLGQVLEIPSSQAWVDASPFWVVHEVASGETLSEIAADYGLTLDDLQAANASLDPDHIAVGEEVVLPIGAPADLLAKVEVSPTEAPTPEPSAVPETFAATQAEPDPIAAADAEGDAAANGAIEASVEPTAEPVPTQMPEVADPPDAPAPPVDLAALPGEIFRLLNEQRAAYGLPPLTWNDTLASAAQRHADDCEARGWCGHSGSDGSSYKERIIREGYDPVRWSECWAWYGSAEKAVAMWMDEAPPNDPHRRTILSDYLTEVGVGVVRGNGYGYYFIADFGTPAN